MPEFDFSEPQRQSKVGLILIFLTSLFAFIKSLWIVIFSFFLLREISTQTLFFGGAGLILVLLFILGYSILSYLRFKFSIDQKNEEFVLQKGVFSSDVTNIPFEKIQQVNFKRNILQRIIGVYSVVIETAGSDEKEVEIKALSQEKAEALSDRLMKLSRSANIPDEDRQNIYDDSEEEAVAQSASVPEWEYKVGLLTLAKLGLTSNYLRGIGLILIFYSTLREQFLFVEERVPTSLTQTVDLVYLGTISFVVLFLLLGIVFTVGETVVKYFGLHLKKFDDTLQVEMGLMNNTRVNIKANRIQLMQVLTNPIQRRLGLYKLKISLASSEDELEKNQIKIVGLPPEVVLQVKDYFYKGEINEKLQIHPHIFELWRNIIQSFIPLIIFLGILLFNYELLSVYWFTGIAVVYTVVMTIYNYLYFKQLKLGVSEEFLIRYSGVWVKKEEYIEMFRLQSVSVHQRLWHKRRGLVSLTFHSAGGDISSSLVKKDEVQPLINYLMYKIESTSRSWM